MAHSSDSAAGADNIVGVILAGGLSRRMGGGDKCLRPLAGQPMLAHVVARLRDQAGTLVINANGDPARFSAFGLPIAPDPIAGFAGPLVGVLAGLFWVRENRPEIGAIVTVPGDAPFLPRRLVADFVAAADGAPRRIVLAQSGGRTHPVAGLWPVALADDLHDAVEGGVRKVLAWTDRHETVTVEFPPETIGDTVIDPFFNANTPEELGEAEALLARGVSS